MNVVDDYLLLHIVAQFQKKTTINTTPTQFIITHNSYTGTTITTTNIRLARANLYIGFSVLHEETVPSTTTLLNLLTNPNEMNTHTHTSVKNW